MSYLSCLMSPISLFVIALTISSPWTSSHIYAQPQSIVDRADVKRDKDTALSELSGVALGLDLKYGSRALQARPRALLIFSHVVDKDIALTRCAYHQINNKGKSLSVIIRAELDPTYSSSTLKTKKRKRALAEGRAFVIRPVSRLEWDTRWALKCDAQLQRTMSAPVDRGQTRHAGARAPVAERALKHFKPLTFYALQSLRGTTNLQDPDTHVKSNAQLSISFNYNVSVKALLKGCAYLNLETQEKTPIDAKSYYKKREKSSYIWVFAKSALPANTRFSFKCVGLTSSASGAPLTQFEELTFKTYPPLRYQSVSYPKRAIPSRRSTLDIIFSNQLKAPYKISSTPPIPNLAKHCYTSYNRSGVRCEISLEAQGNYQINIDPDQEDIYGQRLGYHQVITLDTGDNLPAVSLETGYYIAELKRPIFPLWSQNTSQVMLTIAEVTPDQFYSIQPELNWWSSESLDLQSLDLALTRLKYKTPGQRNQWKQHLIDPAKLLHHREVRSGMYYVELDSAEVKKDGGSNHHHKALVNFTDLGVVSKIAQAQGFVWVTRLSSGDSVRGADVSVRNGLGEKVWRGETDEQGLVLIPAKIELTQPETLIARDEAQLKLSGNAATQREQLERHRAWLKKRNIKRRTLHIFAQTESDWTMVNPSRSGSLNTSYFNVSVDYSNSPVLLRGFLHTDRGLYKPGEMLHVKGLARESRLGGALTPPQDSHATVMIYDPRGVKIKELEVEVSPYGGFWFDFQLPDDAKLGDYKLYANLEHGSFSRAFSVEVFKPLNFEVEARAMTERIEREGELKAEVKARYLYGSPLRRGDVKVSVHSRPKRVTFKAFSEYIFYDTTRLSEYHSAYSDQRLLTERRVQLDARGVTSVSIPIDATSQLTRDADLITRLAVSNASNEMISKSVVVPYFKHKTYIGIHGGDSFVKSGEPHEIELVSVNARGTRVASSAEVTIIRPDWSCVWRDWGYRGSYDCSKKLVEVFKRAVTLSADQPTRFSFTPTLGGEYQIKVKGADQHVASREVYAWGGVTSYPSEDSMTFDMISDQKSYEVGDEAVLVFKTDLTHARGLVSIERKGVIETWPIEVTPTTQYVKIPIKESYAPNVYVSVALVQPRIGEGRRAQPRMRMGIQTLNVRSKANRLKVSVTSDHETYVPGAEVTATVRVHDALGAPVRAEVALTAADEGVLSLINFKTPDPIPTFYAAWGLGTDAATQYAYIKTIPSPNLKRPATGGDSNAPGTIRSRFLASAVWRPGLITDARGEARVRFKAPDNLTAFRMMAIAADQGQRFGSSDQRFKVALPLQLHRNLPRFLSLGDRVSLGVVVHNETGATGEATVRLTLDDKLVAHTAGELTRRVLVKAGDQVAVLFDVEARALGESALAFSVELGEHRDAARFKLPVYHPAPLESYEIGAGTSDAAVTTLKITPPTGMISESATASISVDPSGLAGIERGLKELIRYPYGCLEQTTSKLIPMVTTRALAESLKLDGLTGEELDRFARAGIKRIKKHQVESGGFSLWQGGRARPYYTAYALWGLHLARQAGYADQVGEETLKMGLNYLRHRPKSNDTRSVYINARHELGTQAFGLYVRALLGDADPQAALRLSERASELNAYGQSLLALTLTLSFNAKHPKVRASLELLRTDLAAARLQDKLLDEDAESSWYMSDRVRSSAVALEALLTIDPQSEYIPYLVTRLMRERRQRAHLSTQANLYSLLALTRYARSLEREPIRVSVLLGDETISERTLNHAHQLLTVSRPLNDARALKIKANGRIYYHAELELRRRPELYTARSADHFAVQRVYLDERGDPQSVFKVGDIVTVQLTLPVSHWVNHLMLSDRIPAGFEALNAKFSSVNGVQRDTRSPFFRELHAERVDFATEYLRRGDYVVEYKIRALAVGDFALPPARAELMYEPNELAQTDYQRLIVLPK